jgi:ATP-dependent Clp protease ATP-binding subunit ClpC
VFEGFSDRARAAVAAATDEARRLAHEQVGTEHLLLGLLADHDGGTASLLRDAGATLEAARHKVAEVVAVGEGHGDDLPFTDRARRALERAARFSRHERAPKVRADHVLLGVLDVEGLGCQVLRGLGVDVSHLREAVTAAGAGTGAPLGSAAAPTEPDEPVEPAEAMAAGPTCGSCGAALDGSLSGRVLDARGEAGTTPRVLVLYCAACGIAVGVVPPS